MVNKPSETHTVGISWELFQKVKNEAIEKKVSIKKVIEDKIRSANNTEAPSSEKVYVCPECGEEWDTKQQLRGHMRKHDEAGKTDEELEEFVKGLEFVDVEDIREDS